MPYLIIIDNGKMYSDHEHAPLMSVNTMREAELALESFRNWHKRWPKDADGDYIELTYEYGDISGPAWLKANPPAAPIPDEMLSAYGQENTTFAILEVPGWKIVDSDTQR